MRKLIIIGLIFLIGCAMPKPSMKDLEEANCGIYPNDYEKIVKEYLNEHLKDPSSLIDLKISSPRKDYIITIEDNSFSNLFSGGKILYCYSVEVKYNAKNSFGGYVGKQTKYCFIYNNRILQWCEYDYR